MNALRWRVGLALLVLVLAGAAFYFYSRPNFTAESVTRGLAAPYVVPELADEYRNKAHGFAVMVPADFAVQEMPEGEAGSEFIVIQNAAGDGIQIAISPFDEDLRELTADRVLADIPDLRMTDIQPVEIGEDHLGLAFKSDNEAFGGASREVWFVFRGALYQISTYERLDPLLRAMFATWRFF